MGRFLPLARLGGPHCHRIRRAPVPAMAPPRHLRHLSLPLRQNCATRARRFADPAVHAAARPGHRCDTAAITSICWWWRVAPCTRPCRLWAPPSCSAASSSSPSPSCTSAPPGASASTPTKSRGSSRTGSTATPATPSTSACSRQSPATRACSDRAVRHSTGRHLIGMRAQIAGEEAYLLHHLRRPLPRLLPAASAAWLPGVGKL